MISGIILSSAVSSDDGKPVKLPGSVEAKFLRQILTIFRSARITENNIVIREGERDFINHFSDGGVKIIFSLQPESGVISSVRTGIVNVSGTDIHGVIVCPVNYPLITQKLIVELLQDFWRSQKNIIIPVCDGKRGYPVIFGVKMFDALKTAPPEEGVPDMIRSHQNETCEVITHENGAILKISSLEEYKKQTGVLRNA
jgi:molybdenum cofactor cytidylyltransferase